MKTNIIKARELLIKAIKSSGNSFARSLYRKVPPKKILPLLREAKKILLDEFAHNKKDSTVLYLLSQIEEEYCHFSSALKYFNKYLSISKSNNKKDLKHLYELQQHMKTQATLKITAEKLNKLKRFLDTELSKNKCDHSFRYLKIWALENSINFNEISKALNNCGAFCDCEILWNIEL